jgi:hypothetical protein
MNYREWKILSPLEVPTELFFHDRRPHIIWHSTSSHYHHYYYYYYYDMAAQF